MLWFLIWTLLVLATLGGAFLLGRDLWRKSKALLAEVRRAAEVAEALAATADRIAAEAAAVPPITHDLLTDYRVHLARVDALADERAERRELRRQRHARTAAGWRAYWR